MIKNSGILLFIFFLIPLSLWAQSRTITGVITDGVEPLDNVSIRIKDTGETTTSDAKGKYEILANKGDILQYRLLGMKEIEVLVEDVTRFLNITMYPDFEELDEVVVEGRTKETQRELALSYRNKKSVVRTSFGFVDAETSGGSIKVISEEDINDSALCILDMVRGNFASVRVVGDCVTGGNLVIRGAGSINNPRTAIFDVDGLILKDAPIWLLPSQIKRIAILSGLGLTAKYGSAAAGGVVVINTSNSAQLRGPNGEKNYDYAKLRDNFVTEKPISSEEASNYDPNYLKEIRLAASLQEALALYEKYKKSYGEYPFFYLDSYRHFAQDRGAVAEADAIISKNYQLFESNATLLKALGYLYQEDGRHTEANEVFKKVFSKRPGYIQSYMDLALNYADNDNLTKATALFSRFNLLVENGQFPDSLEINALMDREFNNLLMRHSKDILKKSTAKKVFVDEEEMQGTRLVFEWNDSEAEFDIQFVNPGNQYYTWSHTMEENYELIVQEKQYGFSAIEYYMDASMTGLWKINVKYLGNKSLTPTFLKVTQYTNYGTVDQQKEIQVIKLSLKNANMEFIQLNNRGIFSTKR